MINRILVGVLFLSLSAVVRGEIYETRDAQGNPVFTDTPSQGAREIQLHEENIADPVTPSADEEGGLSPKASPGAADSDHSQIVIIPDSHNEAVEEAIEEGQRREVLEADPRREVRDASPRREVGDFGQKQAR